MRRNLDPNVFILIEYSRDPLQRPAGSWFYMVPAKFEHQIFDDPL